MRPITVNFSPLVSRRGSCIFVYVYCNYIAGLLEKLFIVFLGEERPWERSRCPPASLLEAIINAFTGLSVKLLLRGLI